MAELLDHDRRDDLIFPIHYNSVEHLDPHRPEDCHSRDVLLFLRRRQGVDFRPFRLKNQEGEDVA